MTRSDKYLTPNSFSHGFLREVLAEAVEERSSEPADNAASGKEQQISRHTEAVEEDSCPPSEDRSENGRDALRTREGEKEC